MADHRTIEMGGGGPVVESSGTALPSDLETREPGRAEIVLGIGNDAQDAGHQVLELVRDAIASGNTERAVRKLATLVFEFPRIALRSPELHDFMNWLVTSRKDDAVARVLSEALRGRRREHHNLVVGLVDLVIQQEGGSVRAAAERVAKRVNISAAAIQNRYSEHKRLYDLHRSPRYVSAGELTRNPWARKGR